MNVTSNVIDNKELKDIIESTLTHVSERLALSLGPYGSTAIVERRDRLHYTTKDGYTILKDMYLGDNISNTILDLIKRISEELVIKVGDGSTSSIIAAKELYFSLKRFQEKHNLRSKELIDLLKVASDEIIEGIKKLSYKLSATDTDLVKNIASVSLNNDENVGSLIQEIYEQISESGSIHVKYSETSKTYYKIIDGYELGAGYIDAILANAPLGECIMKNADILMIDGKMDSDFVNHLNSLIVQYTNTMTNPNNKDKLVIICGGIDDTVQLFLRRVFTYTNQNNVPKNINIIVMDIYDKGRDIFEDFAIKIGARPFKKDLDEQFDVENTENYYGKVKEIVSNKSNTFVYFDNDESDIIKECIEERKNLLASELELLKDNFEAKAEIDKLRLKKRLDMLNGGKIASIYVGGETDFEKDCNKFLIDDAISACKSAFDNGYVVGCNMSISRAIEDILENIAKSLTEDITNIDKINKYFDLLKEIKHAFYKVFFTIFKNRFTNSDDDNLIADIYSDCVNKYEAYDLINDEYTFSKIINSAQTDIEILKTTISIISLIYSSNLFISAR